MDPDAEAAVERLLAKDYLRHVSCGVDGLGLSADADNTAFN